MNEFISLVIGIFMPVVISFLKDSRWPQSLKTLVALGVCVIIAAAQVIVRALVLNQPISRTAWITTAGLVFSAATASYKFWFESTTLNQQLTQKKVF